MVCQATNDMVDLHSNSTGRLQGLIDGNQCHNIFCRLLDRRTILFDKLGRVLQTGQDNRQEFFRNRSKSRTARRFELTQLHVYDLHLLVELMHFFGVNQPITLHLGSVFFRFSKILQRFGQGHTAGPQRIHNEFLPVPRFSGLSIALSQLFKLFVDRQELAVLVRHGNANSFKDSLGFLSRFRRATDIFIHSHDSNGRGIRITTCEREDFLKFSRLSCGNA